MNLDKNLDLKLLALDEAISYPAYREVKDATTFEIETFDYSNVSEMIKSNEKLTNLEGATINLLLEVTQLLDNYKKKFNVDMHQYIGFYWRGLPILIIKTKDSDDPPPRMMYISVKVYKDDLAERIADKKVNRTVVGTLGGILLLGGIAAGYFFITKNNN